MNQWIKFFVKKRLFGNLLTLFVLIVGVMSIVLTRTEVFPNVDFDVIRVVTAFPGASPEEVEKLLTNPLELELKEVDGIKKMRSISVENQSVIILQLDPDQTNEDDAKSDVRDVIDRFEKPAGSEDPKIASLSTKQNPIVEVTLQGDLDEIELRRLAKELEREIEKISGVAKVATNGIRDLEIKVEADPKKLARYRISLDEMIRAIQGQNVSIPAGSIEAKTDSMSDQEFLVRTIGEFEKADDVANTVVRANEYGQPILIKDLAKVTYGLEKAKELSRTNGSPSVSLVVLRKETSDAIKLVDLVKAHVDSKQDFLSEKGVSISYINDMSEYVRRRVGVLTGNLFIGLALVLLVLTLLLRVRIALIVSLGIPFSFLGGMIIFYYMGYSINLISLLGFIIVSGMLVDDAVVVTDNAARLIEEGMDPEEAALKGTQQIWKAVTASVLTTLMAFLPMLFMTGIFGKFVRQIPLGVILALLASLFEAFFILPQHIAHSVRRSDLLPATRGKEVKWYARVGEWFKHFWDEKVTPKYLSILNRLLDHRKKVVAGVVLLFFVSVGVAATSMRFVLFPPDGIEIFFVRLGLPGGTSLAATEKLLVTIEKEIQKLPPNELKNMVTRIGIQQKEPNDPNTKRGSNYGQVYVYLQPEEERDRTAAEIIEYLKGTIVKPEGALELTFERAGGGPPVGKPISVSIRGSKYTEILPVVQELEAKIAKLEGAIDVTNSYVAGKEEIQVIVNGSEAKAAQLSVAQIGNTVRAAYDGIAASTIQLLDDEVDVRVSFPPEDRKEKASLKQIYVPNATGNLIPLDQVADFREGRGLSVYEHENNEREIRITGELDTSITSSGEMAKRIEREFFADYRKQYPHLTFSFGGEDEDTQESMQSLIRAFGIAAMGILFILILTFESLVQPFLVLLAIPFGIIGVIWAFFFHGMPFSFMGMLGIIALAGVIVNNAIVFIDSSNELRKEGMDQRKSILEAARQRLRPIFLTTFTTVCGLMPTAYGLGGLDKFVVPIAMALGWGMVVGSLLTVFAFPTSMAVLDDVHDGMIKLWNRLRKKMA